MRFIGRREGVPPELVERMDWAEADDRRQRRGSRSSSPSTTAAGRRSSTRREASRGSSEEEFRQPPLRARDARPRPADPNQRRAAGSPTTCSGSAPTRSSSSATSSGPTSAATALEQSLREFETRASAASARGPDGPLRRRHVRGRAAARDAEPRPPREPRRRRGDRGETVKRILVAIPWIVFAIAIVVAGGIYFALAMIAIGILCLREFLAMTERAAADPARRLHRRPGADRRRLLRHRLQRAAGPRRLLPGDLRLRRRPQAPRRDRRLDGGDAARHRLDRDPARPRRPAPRPARPRRGAARRRPRRHLRHRHRRLRDRAHVRLPQDRPQPLAEQDDRGPDRRLRDRHDGLLVRRALPGLADREPTR